VAAVGEATVGQQQQRPLAQAQGADTGREFQAGFVGFLEQHGEGARQ